MFNILKLKNCPNCGATLNDFGRCEYCGSKVYDLTDIDLRTSYHDRAKTYLRIRTDHGILVVPAICNEFNIQRSSEDSILYADNRVMASMTIPYHTKISLEFTVTDDYIKIMKEGE